MKNYIAEQRELIQLDYKLETEEKQKGENLIPSIDLFFILRSKSLPGESKGSRNWTTTLPLPKNLIPPEYLLITSPTYVNVSDKMTVEFLDCDKEPITGTVMKIGGGELTASFELDWEEDSARHKCSIKFAPNDTVYKWKLRSLKKLKNLNDDIKNVLCRIYPTNIRIPKIQLNLPSKYNFNESQKKAIRMAVSNPFSLIQGPPGTGKTHTIGAIVIQALRMYPTKKVLVCGTTNVSINSLLEIVGDMVQDAGFEVCWPAASSRDFLTDENLTKEQKLMTLYKCQNMNSSDSRRFKELRNRHDVTERDLAEMKRLRNKLEDQIIRESNVIFSTLDSSGKSSIVNNIGDISVLIVDEATLSVESSMIIPLALCPERFVLVGDHKQLGPQPSFDELQSKGYYYSMFERIIKERSCLRNSVMLNTQYRMHPDISCLPNKLFYNNQLIDGVTSEDRMISSKFEFKKHLNFININGEEEKNGTSFINTDEIYQVSKFVNSLVDSGVDPSQIGIISAYGAQTQLISEHFRNYGPRVKVSTIDSFQGSQKDYILICTTRNGADIGFLKDRRRMNVAITRARRMVAIFGNEISLSQSEFWYNVIQYTKNNDSFYERLPSSFGKNHRKHVIISKNSNNLVREMVSEFKEEEYEAGYNLSEIKSEISDSNVRILWPDENDDIDFLKEWVEKRINILNNNKHVTLSYDAEGVCMQFGDIFDENVDYYNWEPGIEIPEIKTNESIIISIFEHKGDHNRDSSLVDIMKPLLEHPKITFITFDFTYDFDKFVDFGINIQTNQIIDVQLMSLPENDGLNENEDLVCSTGWKSIARFIQQVNEDNINANIIFRAKESVKKRKKDFPHEENNFLISHLKYPSICQFTKVFLEYSAGDIFYTAIVGIDVLSRGELDIVKERSLQKFNSYNEYIMKYKHAQLARQAYYNRGSITSVLELQYFTELSTKDLFIQYRRFNFFVSILDKCPELVQKIIPSFTEDDSSKIKQKYKEIIDIILNPEKVHIGIVKDKAILSHVNGIQKKPAFVLRVKEEVDEVQEEINQENKVAQEKIEHENEQIFQITGGKNSFKKKSECTAWTNIDMSKPIIINNVEKKSTNQQTQKPSKSTTTKYPSKQLKKVSQPHQEKTQETPKQIMKPVNSAWKTFSESQENKSTGTTKPQQNQPSTNKNQFIPPQKKSIKPTNSHNTYNSSNSNRKVAQHPKPPMKPQKTERTSVSNFKLVPPKPENPVNLMKPVNSVWKNFTESQENKSTGIRKVPPPPPPKESTQPTKVSKQQSLSPSTSSSLLVQKPPKQINATEDNGQIGTHNDIIMS